MIYRKQPLTHPAEGTVMYLIRAAALGGAAALFFGVLAGPAEAAQVAAAPAVSVAHTPAGHHFGWQRGRGNPHRRPVNPCAVFHIGCPSDVQVPPPPFVGHPHFPG